MKDKLFVIVIIMLGWSNMSQAQISHGGTPVSFTDTICMAQGSVMCVTLPLVDSDSLLQVDSLMQAADTGDVFNTFRFGISIAVNAGLTSSGTWETLADSTRLWRLHLKSVSAHSGYLIFDKFFLPKGAKLFAYSEDNAQVIGAFTEKNNKLYNRFSLGPIIGESIILEYIEPPDVDTTAEINVTAFVHDFKNVYNTHIVDGNGNDLFGLSDACHVNVYCEHPNFCNQRRSVAQIAQLNPVPGHFAALCSGALIKNTKGDLRPYFLTANHCLNGNEGTWIFIFNYQAPMCADPPAAPPTNFSIVGANVRANRCKSDFALLELTARPPGEFNAFYAGFNNKNEKPKSGMNIHHPNGDVKMITTYDKKGKRRFPQFPNCKVKSWKIKYDDGGRQGGSSGSPLFNEDNLIVGQLTGGKDKNICKKGKYGRFDKSWDDGGSASNQLEDWLGESFPSIISITGEENCKISYVFTNANDLHTSDNLISGIFFNTRTYNGVYEVTNTITTGVNVTIQNGTSVVFDAGQQIRLLPGFHAEAGSNFHAFIEGCLRGCGNGFKTGEGTGEDEPYIVIADTLDEPVDLNEFYDFNVYPNPTAGRFTIEFDAYEDVQAEVYVYSLLGKVIYKTTTYSSIVNVDIQNEPKGIYLIRIVQGAETYYGKIVHQ